MKKNIMLIAAPLLLSVLIFTSCAEPDIPQGYALIYGVSDYSTFNSLSFTDDDAAALSELLDEKGWEVYGGINEDADMASVTADVNEVAGIMKPNDRVLFYFSGHGGPVDLNGGEPSYSADSLDEIIVLYDADDVVSSYMQGNTNADVLSVTLSDDSLAELLSELPTDNKTVIIDACNSGGFVNPAFTYNAIPQQYYIDKPYTVFTPSESFYMYMNYTASSSDLPYTDYAVLAASGELEESYEISSLGHGVFTYFLLNSPEKADYNYDGYITLIEAWQYISTSIDNYWNSSVYIDQDAQYMPNIGAFPVDPVLFKAD